MATAADYYTINGQQPIFFTEGHLGQSFVRTQPNKEDSSFMLISLNATEVTKYRALILNTISQNGDIEFSNSDRNHPFTLKATWNDGNWMPLQSCLELIRTNSSSIQPASARAQLEPSSVQRIHPDQT